jgi:hypothetical protein
MMNQSKQQKLKEQAISPIIEESDMSQMTPNS